jgi:hypothetical protein
MNPSITIYKNYYTTFASNNKLHQYLHNCTTLSINAVTLKGKPTPNLLDVKCIKSVTNLLASLPSYVFHGWSYTMAIVYISSMAGPYHKI